MLYFFLLKRAQQCLKEIGKAMNDICETQELPCSLAKFMPQVEELEWMTANDIMRWCAEQGQDLVSNL